MGTGGYTMHMDLGCSRIDPDLLAVDRQTQRVSKILSD